jgi:hypothetical protein
MKFVEFLQEKSGCLSSTRLGFLVWVIGTLIVWAVCSFKTGILLEIPSSVQVIFGILMSGKVVQKFGEKDGLALNAQPPKKPSE